MNKPFINANKDRLNIAILKAQFFIQQSLLELKDISTYPVRIVNRTLTIIKQFSKIYVQFYAVSNLLKLHDYYISAEQMAENFQSQMALQNYCLTLAADNQLLQTKYIIDKIAKQIDSMSIDDQELKINMSKYLAGLSEYLDEYRFQLLLAKQYRIGANLTDSNEYK